MKVKLNFSNNGKSSIYNHHLNKFGGIWDPHVLNPV